MTLPEITPELRSEVKDLFEENVCLQVAITPQRTTITYFDYELSVDRANRLVSFYHFFDRHNNGQATRSSLPLVPHKLLQTIELSYVFCKIQNHIYNKYKLNFKPYDETIPWKKFCARLANTLFGINIHGMRKTIAKAIHEAFDKDIYKMAIKLEGHHADTSTYTWVWQNWEFIQRYMDTEPGRVALACRCRWRIGDNAIMNLNPEIFDNYMISHNWGNGQRIPEFYRDPSVSEEEQWIRGYQLVYKLPINQVSIIEAGSITTPIFLLLMDKLGIKKLNYSLLKEISWRGWMNEMLSGLAGDEARDKYTVFLRTAFEAADTAKRKREFVKLFREISQFYFTPARLAMVSQRISIRSCELSSSSTWQDVLGYFNEHKQIEDLEREFIRAVTMTGDGAVESDYDGDILF